MLSRTYYAQFNARIIRAPLVTGTPTHSVLSSMKGGTRVNSTITTLYNSDPCTGICHSLMWWWYGDWLVW